MKYKDKLTHSEKTQAIADCLRDIMSVEVSHRTMPNLLNRGRAIASLISADQREEIMEARRQAVQTLVIEAEKKEIKKLKRVYKKKNSEIINVESVQ